VRFQKSQIGFYFHIPFCPHICPYCDFTKTSKFQKKDVLIYFKELEDQLDYFLGILKRMDLATAPMEGPQDDSPNYATVYFGGGTPGLFKAEFYKPLLDKLKQYFILEEVTLETNPYTNYEKNFLDYRSVGFDRLTLGAQSLCPKTLISLGRKHTPQDVLNNLEWAKIAGFEQIQVDLIYGLKKGLRTLNIEQEVAILHAAGASGISGYFLTLEKRTLFANSNLADEENGVEEYAKLLEKCSSLGLRQIETSNFSKQEAKHNNLYWYGLPYIGIGTGAHGLLPSTDKHPYGIRYKIGSDAQSSEPGNDILIYRENKACKDNFQIIYDTPRTRQDYLEENIFTLLRTPTGIDLNWLIHKTGDSHVVQKLLNHARLERGLAEGKLHHRENRIYLSAEEKIRGDAWALDFISIIL
jgi:oxygen-independent coproporphyrinogen-3 oxidase